MSRRGILGRNPWDLPRLTLGPLGCKDAGEPFACVLFAENSPGSLGINDYGTIVAEHWALGQPLILEHADSDSRAADQIPRLRLHVPTLFSSVWVTSAKADWTRYTVVPDGEGYAHTATTTSLANMEAAAAEKGLIRINPALVSEIKIDRANSWVVDGQESDELLSHEQGHVDIHLLVEYEKLRELIKLRAKGMRQLKRALLETEHRFQRKLEALNKFYDSPRETDHSRNKQKQSEWEKMIEQHIQAEFAPLANPPAGHKGDEKHSNHKR